MQSILRDSCRAPFAGNVGALIAGPRLKSRGITRLTVRCKEEFKDTRIHYSSTSTEGWIGGDSSPKRLVNPGDASIYRVGAELLPLLLAAPESHYKYLGISPDADAEEIKSAYRRLTKLYHPDTTNLPIELAAQKFMRLKEAYTVLTSLEKRRFYDWQLAQTVSKEEFDRFMRPKDWNSANSRRPPTPSQSQSGGDENGNIPLSDQAMTALVFDLFALAIALIAIIYVALFKNSTG